MAILLVATALSAGFGLIMRASQRRDCNIWAVGMINYLIAFLFHGSRAFWEGGGFSSQAVLFGLVIGVVYAIDFGLYAPLLHMRGVSITMAMARISIIVPMLASLLIWRETVTPWLGVSALVALIALPLLVIKPHMTEQFLPRRAFWFGLALFIGTGAERTLMKAFQEQTQTGQDALFFTLLFGTAGLVTLGNWLYRDRRISIADVSWGVALGLINAGTNLGLLVSLRMLPGVLVFPFFAVISLVFAGLFARLAWGERLSQREMIGIVLAIVAVTLANIQHR